MPRITPLVSFSVSLYRLLLIAYPAAFRNEYGEVMVQLFRDMACDAYQHCGLLGLSALWLRTLADFTVSVIRQHRDKPEEATSETVLLRDLMRQWSQCGAAALATTALSIWYTFHLLQLFSRRSIRIWATLTLVTFGIWFSSFFTGLGTHSFGVGGPAFRFEEGSMQIRYAYEYGEPLLLEQWHKQIRQVQYDPSFIDRLAKKPSAWEFSFLSGITGAQTISTNAVTHRKLVQPYNSWRLRLPFGILPMFLLVGTIRVYLRRNAGSTAAVQSA